MMAMSIKIFLCVLPILAMLFLSSCNSHKKNVEDDIEEIKITDINFLMVG